MGKTLSKKFILQWELTGIVLIFVAGSFFHFVFKLTGQWPPVALIGAVNESVWEHLKLAFWPALIYALAEFPFLKNTKNFWTSKSFGILSMPLAIVILFYGYTSLIGHHILWVDIALFGFAVSIGQMISFRLMTGRLLSRKVKFIGAVLLLIMILAFSLFSYLPPHFSLFRDSVSGQYGFLK
ncbi:MAG: DUF6512 family protein [Candidatus Aminicenantes bacterium]|jgi:hypothetical protein